MRIHAASASAGISRTLEQIILASGHQPVSAGEAELLLLDQLHPPKSVPAHCPHLVLGDAPPGGAEFLRVPFAPRQLMRLLAVRGTGQSALLLQGWQIDPTARSLAHSGGARITLTEKECALLVCLTGAYPETMSHDALLAEVWGLRQEIDTHTLETHIYRLRSKLEALQPVPCDIVTVGGAYKLVMTV